MPADDAPLLGELDCLPSPREETRLGKGGRLGSLMVCFEDDDDDEGEGRECGCWMLLFDDGRAVAAGGEYMQTGESGFLADLSTRALEGDRAAMGDEYTECVSCSQSNVYRSLLLAVARCLFLFSAVGVADLPGEILLCHCLKQGSGCATPVSADSTSVYSMPAYLSQAPLLFSLAFPLQQPVDLGPQEG